MSIAHAPRRGCHLQYHQLSVPIRVVVFEGAALPFAFGVLILTFNRNSPLVTLRIPTTTLPDT